MYDHYCRNYILWRQAKNLSLHLIVIRKLGTSITKSSQESPLKKTIWRLCSTNQTQMMAPSIQKAQALSSISMTFLRYSCAPVSEPWVHVFVSSVPPSLAMPQSIWLSLTYKPHHLLPQRKNIFKKGNFSPFIEVQFGKCSSFVCQQEVLLLLASLPTDERRLQRTCSSFLLFWNLQCCFWLFQNWYQLKYYKHTFKKQIYKVFPRF